MMIKKNTNAYAQIKKNIVKLALIQQATEISPARLVSIFLNYVNGGAVNDLSSANPPTSTYKYFCKLLSEYKKNQVGNGHNTLLEFIGSNYLSKEYLGEKYEEVLLDFKAQEKAVKDFVREAFKSVFPITPDMTPAEVGARNQRLGKISVDMWVGDILNYRFFNDAPGFMMENLKRSLFRVDLYVINLLNDSQLEIDIMKLSTNQRLEIKLQPRQSITPKIAKI